ncbi:RNA polymerase sigma factor [Piscicoccus intestinalis]|uniref:RNA polymerase sigma factor n=1 Tax=Piscicoccus intestinalis TaxID=746033 RepID=UPI000839236E|nr:DUF6596 domain-containing protein [Piscicoccus intestinalis]
MSTTEPVRAVAEERARTGYGRLLALLSSATNDIAAAEDALADAFERALRAWPESGIPAYPDAWLLTVARNRLRDRWKSAEHTRTQQLDPEAGGLPHVLDDIDPDAIPDRRLELMLVCAHPAIAANARTALMLNTVLGFTAEQIARAYAVPAPTMSTRLTRAKSRIKAAHIPFRIPDRSDLPDRLDTLLEAVYAAYTIEWSTGPEASGLPPEGLQLAQVLAELMPRDAEVRGLAALVDLSAARRSARTDDEGRFVPLARQDPSRWNRALIDRGRAHLAAAHGLGELGRFQLEAAIQALHCARIDGTEPDPTLLLQLHRALVDLAPSLGAVTALASVTADVDGPNAGLAVLDSQAGPGDTASRYQPAWVTRAHLLARAGRHADALKALDKALSLTHDPSQRAHLEGLRREWSTAG